MIAHVLQTFSVKAGECKRIWIMRAVVI